MNPYDGQLDYYGGQQRYYAPANPQQSQRVGPEAYEDFQPSGQPTGLLDMFGGSAPGMSASDPGALYGGLLSPMQNRALAYRGLLGAAGALGAAAMPSRMPIPIGAALGSAAGAMGNAYDQAGTNALKGQLLGLQGQGLQFQLGLKQAILNMLQGNGQAPGVNAAPGTQSGLLGSPAPGAQTSAAPAISGSDDVINYGKQVAAKYGIPWDVFSHQIAGESSWNPNVGKSSAGAEGIAQFEPGTAKKYGVDVNDWQSSLDGAGRYMADLYKQSGTWTGALSGYLTGNPNQGEITSVTKQNPQYAAAYAAASAADKAPGPQYAQADTGTATDATPSVDPGVRPPPTPGTLIENGGVPGITANRAQGTATPFARSLVAAGVNPPNAATSSPTFAPGAPAPQPVAQAQQPGLLAPTTAPPQAPAAPAQPGLLSPAAVPQQAQAQPGLLRPGGGASLGPQQPMLGNLNLSDPKSVVGLEILGGMAGVPGLAQALQNSPAYQAAIARAKLPYTGQRPGSGLPEVDANGNPTGRYTTVPTVQTRSNPDGSTYQVYTQDTPNGPVETRLPGTVAIAPGEKTRQEKQAEANVEYGGLLNPQATPGNSANKPVQTPQGTSIPPATEQGVVPNTPAELKSAIPAWQKKQEEWTSAVVPAQQAEQRLMTTANMFKMVQTGAWQTDKAAFDAGMKSLGLPSQFTDPAAVETALHETYKQTLNVLKTTNPRFAQKEFTVLSENSESPDIQPAANLQMLSEDIATMRQAQQMPRDFIQAQQMGWKNPLAFETQWQAANPLSAEVDKVKQQIGPLKGMPGTELPQGAVPHMYNGRPAMYQGRPVYEVPDGKGGTKLQVMQ